MIIQANDQRFEPRLPANLPSSEPITHWTTKGDPLCTLSSNTNTQGLCKNHVHILIIFCFGLYFVIRCGWQAGADSDDPSLQH